MGPRDGNEIERDTLLDNMRGLEITERQLDGDWTSLEVVGEIDLATVDELISAIKQVQSAGVTRLMVDLTETAFMDSTGLKALVVAHREFTEAGKEFAISVKPGPIERLVELSGVGSAMTVVGGVEELLGN
jgi:anti-anti-sigma factor